MGRSDPLLFPVYRELVHRAKPMALLGSRYPAAFGDPEIAALEPDVFDVSFPFDSSGYWDINSRWVLPRRYASIVCTRCAYFAKDPIGFLEICRDHLLPGGQLLVDWGLGDHWRFPMFKVGWIKDGEHEHAYAEWNRLWSTVWHSSLLDEPEVMRFAERIRPLGYGDLTAAIIDEVPAVASLSAVEEMFSWVSVKTLALWDDQPQLYIILRCSL